MKNKVATGIISLFLLLAIIAVAFYFPALRFSYSGIVNNSYPRRYYDYDDSFKAPFYSVPTIPFLFLIISYSTLQVFIIKNIKVVYGSFKSIRVMLYLLITSVLALFTLIPSLLIWLHHMFVAGLNPFLSQLLYLPLIFQIWFWLDMLIRIVLKPKT